MKTQISKPARERTSCTQRQASAPQRGEGGGGAGIRPPLLYRWARTERASDNLGGGRKPRRSLEELEAENHRLRAENAKLWEQREVWAMGPILDAPLTIAALRMAPRQRQPGRTLIVHSDRGSAVRGHRLPPGRGRACLLASMRRPGHC